MALGMGKGLGSGSVAVSAFNGQVGAVVLWVTARDDASGALDFAGSNT
jgi:hypothetical protein